MDDDTKFNKAFDEMIDNILRRINKTKQHEAREAVMKFKKRYPKWFNVEFKEEPEKLQEIILENKAKSAENEEAFVFKKLMDSLLPETEEHFTFNAVKSLATFTDCVTTIKRLQQNLKLCNRRSLHNLLDIATLLELSKKKFRRRYSDVLKEIGYSKSYGSFMLRLLYLTRTYPDLRRVSVSTQYIQTNMKVIERSIYKYFTSPFENNVIVQDSMEISSASNLIKKE